MDLFRERAAWMTDLDDRILETLAVYDGLKLYPLQRRLGREADVDAPVEYVLLRCKRLRECGLVLQHDGYFRLTSTGRAYLDGDVDVATLTDGVDRTVAGDESDPAASRRSEGID